MRCITHPTHDSIFGDTYHGVPSPLVPHQHPYPTRFHGPILNVPQATFPYVERPYARVPFAGPALDACCASCADGGACEGGCAGCPGDCNGCGGLGEDRPRLLSSLTGHSLGDAAVGAAVGYMVSPRREERLLYTAAGGVATWALGTLGLLGTVAGAFYRRGQGAR